MESKKQNNEYEYSLQMNITKQNRLTDNREQTSGYRWGEERGRGNMVRGFINTNYCV